MIGIIGGSGVDEIIEKGTDLSKKTFDTPYCENVEISFFKVGDKKVAFLPRHAEGHSLPPHKINYKANIFALKKAGINQIIATNSVGSLNKEMPPGSIVLPDDFIDFTSQREKTFYNDEVVHVDVTEPYCNRLRKILSNNGNTIDHGVYVCTEGPRFETPAEIKMFSKVGGDLVGMTGLPEVVLAREKEICYSSICIVSNFAVSISENKLTIDEFYDIIKTKQNEVTNLIFNSIADIPNDFDCDCLHALNGAKA
jgi:5'-methylthioadenosine phosphorylase